MGEEAGYLDETIGVDYEFSKYLDEKRKSETKPIVNDRSGAHYCDGYCPNCWKYCPKKRKNGGRIK